MQFDRTPIGPREVGPRKKFQTQIDDGSIQGEDQIGNFRVIAAVLIKTRGFTHEHLRYGGENAPASMFVGIGKIRSRESTAKTKMKLKVLTRGQACDDISQALTKGQLSKTERQKMIKG